MAKHAGYTMETDPETTARAVGKELPISPKAAVEVCSNIRGMTLVKAKTFLEGVIAGTQAVAYRRFLYQIVHQKGGVGPGRFPKKTAKHILAVVENAEANAEYKNLDLEGLTVLSAAASHGRTWHSRMPRAMGRWTQKDRQTVNIEIILEKGSD